MLLTISTEHQHLNLPQLLVRFKRKPHKIILRRDAPSSVLLFCLDSTFNIIGKLFSFSTAIRAWSVQQNHIYLLKMIEKEKQLIIITA